MVIISTHEWGHFGYHHFLILRLTTADNSLTGFFPVHCRMFCRISDPYSLDASSTSLVRTSKNVPRRCRVLSWGKITPLLSIIETGSWWNLLRITNRQEGAEGRILGSASNSQMWTRKNSLLQTLRTGRWRGKGKSEVLMLQNSWGEGRCGARFQRFVAVYGTMEE